MNSMAADIQSGFTRRRPSGPNAHDRREHQRAREQPDAREAGRVDARVLKRQAAQQRIGREGDHRRGREQPGAQHSMPQYVSRSGLMSPQDRRRDLLDRLVRRRQPGDAFAPHQRLGFAHLVAAVVERGVFASRAPLVADVVQPLRVDGEAEALLLVRHHRTGQPSALEVLGNERIVRCLDAVLHRQVQRRGRLAAAAHADEDHIGCLQVLRRLAVVVRQREVDGLDAVGVLLALGDVGEAPDAVVRRHAELGLERLDEGVEHVQHEALGQVLHDGEHLTVDERDEDDGALALDLGRLVDLAHHLVCAVDAVDEGPAHVPRLDGELVEDGVAEGLGGDAGAVGDEVDGLGEGWSHGSRCLGLLR
jgi:hypothetical protein